MARKKNWDRLAEMRGTAGPGRNWGCEHRMFEPVATRLNHNSDAAIEERVQAQLTAIRHKNAQKAQRCSGRGK